MGGFDGIMLPRVAMDTPASETTYTLDADIPCAQCSYNVRGLEAGGRCPECGTAVGESLVRHYQDRRGGRPLSVEDPGRIKWLRRGCEILLLAMGIWCIVHLMTGPDPQFTFPAWEIATALPWAAWILTWIGMILLSLSTRSVISGRTDLVLRWTLRSSATCYAMFPFVRVLESWIRQFDMDLFVGVMRWCGAIAAFTLYRVLMGLAGRLSAGRARIQFEILGLLAAILILLGVERRTVWWGPLEPADLMRRFCSPVFGYHAYLRDLVEQRLWQYWPYIDPLRMIVAAVPFWSTGMLVWLAWRLRGQHRLASLRSASPPKENSPPH